MGYYIEQKETEFFIKKENKDKVLEAIKSIASNGIHYNWVDVQSTINMNTLEEVMEEWRWQPMFDGNGNIIDIKFTGEKLDGEEDFFKTIAPFVQENSFIEIKGEMDDNWTWIFKEGKCKEIYSY